MTSTFASQTARFALTITTPNGSTDDRSVTVRGTLVDQTGASVAGRSVEVDEAGAVLGTATVDANGLWSTSALLRDLGVNAITARTVGDGSEAVTSEPVVLDLQAVLSPPKSFPVSEQSLKRVVPEHDAAVSGEGSATTFVFRPHPGYAVVDGFGLSGAETDRLVLPHSVFGDMANVFRHTTMAGNDAVIHFSPRDSVTLVGVSKAALWTDRGALLFHA